MSNYPLAQRKISSDLLNFLFDKIAILFFLLFSLTTLVSGQQAASATLTGSVTDPNGAVVSGVSIAATQVATGIRRETVTNGEGLFVIPNLSPGDYELRVGLYDPISNQRLPVMKDGKVIGDYVYIYKFSVQ